MLPVAFDRAESELKASVNRIFNEGGSGNQEEQGDSTGVGEGANIQPVVEVVAPVQPRRQGKRKSVVVDAGEASHPPKKLRKDHGNPGGTSVGGKSYSAIKRLLAGAVLNAEVRVAAIPTLPFMTESVSSTPKREAGDHTDSVAEPNLRTIGASQRFVISSDSSHHSGPTIAEAEVDYLARSSPSLFSVDSSSGGGANPHTGVFSDLTGSDFLVGGIRIVIDPDTHLQKIYMRLSAKVRMRAEYNVKERRRLKYVVEKQDELLKARDREIEDLKAQLLLREAEAAEAIRLRAEASNFETVEKSLQDETNALKERKVILEKEWNTLDVKVTDLEASVVNKERKLIDLNAQLTSVKSQNDNLIDRLYRLKLLFRTRLFRKLEFL
ncbi:hypothetical protein Tco_0864006 [Tanacetum coccineum]